MKKVFSLLLAVLMLVSALPVAYAADTNDYEQGTQVVFEAANNEDWTVTVPAALQPGQSGTVTLAGTWPSNKTISVTAESTVTLTNSIKAADTKTLDVTFAGISEAGSDTEAQEFTNPVSVAGIDNALFGTWSGKFNYNVETAIQEPIAATFSDGTELTWEELKLSENGTTYGYTASAISDTSIGARAFSDCTGLTSITIPDGVTSIEVSTFFGCTGLTSITIPDSVTNIGNSAFEKCTGLTSVNIPDSVTNINSRVFYQCTNLTSINIPDSVISIGESAFRYCSGLTSITIPDSVISIEHYAFSDCTGLTSVTIGNHVTSISNYAFYGCTGLTSITIPDSVTKIGSYAFVGCTGLTNAIFENTSGWKLSNDKSYTSSDLEDSAYAAKQLTNKYVSIYIWSRSA